VETIINAAGTFTVLTAACMPPSVLAAVTKAALHPVRLRDLQIKSGEYLAQKLKCEGALVTSGASGAITLATAGCMLNANPKLNYLDLPQNVETLPKKQVVVQKAHRYGYDHAMYLCGARVTEVVTADEAKRAFDTGNAIMTNFFNAAEEEDGPTGQAKIGREEWLRLSHDHNVPCLLDAAADMPPIENLWKYTAMGFDLVCFSGGKGIRGPQNAGLLLGKKNLIELALKNDNPGDGVGRGMKVAKEQIVGMVAAVDWVLSQSEDEMQASYRRGCEVVARAVKNVPSVKTEIVVPLIANHIPHLLIRFDPAKLGVTTPEIVKKLREVKPSIELNPHTGHLPGQGVNSDANTLVVNTWMLQPGEDAIVGRRIRAALLKKA
jgi:L-seryl-tRNA(Ser) seleniumtransferase